MSCSIGIFHIIMSPMLRFGTFNTGMNYHKVQAFTMIKDRGQTFERESIK